MLQKKRLRKKAGCGQAGGPTDIMKACREITAGKGVASSSNAGLVRGGSHFLPVAQQTAAGHILTEP